MIISTLAVALYRINQNSKLKQTLFKEDGTLIYIPAEEVHKQIKKACDKIVTLEVKVNEIDRLSLKTDKHADMCAIASYSIKEFISARLEEFADRIEKKIDKLDSKYEARCKNQDGKIEDLSRKTKTALDRTKHLTSVDQEDGI